MLVPQELYRLQLVESGGAFMPITSELYLSFKNDVLLDSLDHAMFKAHCKEC